MEKLVKEDQQEQQEHQDEDQPESLADRYATLDFDCEYTENLPALLKTLNISLAFTSYQAGRLMLIRSDGESLDVNFKSFRRPMGLAATENGITLGVFAQIVNFQREDGLLAELKKPLQRIEDDVTAPRIKPKEVAADRTEEDEEEDQVQPEDSNEQRDDEGIQLTEEQKEKLEQQRKEVRQYRERLWAAVDERVDSCFITRSAHYSGMINIHDIDWGDEGLWAVNSSFSCLCTIEPDFSFVPRWKPHFISELVPEDRCHLNGMTLREGKPAYVTTFSQYDSQAMWRQGDKDTGTLMEVESNRVLIEGLTMPHSPRWYNDRVYFCNSGHGLLCSYDPNTEDTDIIAEVPGFTRGMDFYGPLAFVGLSKVRASDVSSPAPLAQKYDETFSGIWIFNLTDGSEVGHVTFTGNVDQIYDVAVIPDCCFPELIEPSHPRMRNHFCHPELQPFD